MVGRDADFPTPLIAINGYCSQELVNLLLIGRAHSNVFDGEKNVRALARSGPRPPPLASPRAPGRAAARSQVGGDDGGDATSGGGEGGGVRLKGVPRRALVGFLTLFEKQVPAADGS